MTRYLVAFGVLLTLGSCALGPYAPDFGDATHNNVAVQSVTPPPPAARPVEANGEFATNGLKRYSTDTMKQPVAMSTTNGLEGNGNGNNGTGSTGGTSTSTGQ